jgi:hypothetical protein
MLMLAFPRWEERQKYSRGMLSRGRCESGDGFNPTPKVDQVVPKAT